ncbi:2-hydroxyacid dehydrogenase [Dyadobacter sp. 3J3]|uniref:2-hydroxyacid dehydrogenase n=1 Tax=Dyadobacter sp. 3J3 TaxID=2606600 RepID=UPI00135AD957|nr:2-hydroxyacid dehydrogenase [Dyadobacter sp. 3J3]
MKVVAYSIKTFEKKLLVDANQRKHDITLISNLLRFNTVAFAEGKEAVIVSSNDDLSAEVINKLADLGVKYISTRSAGTDQIDLNAAAERNIQVASVPVYSPVAIAEHAVALSMSLDRHLTQANENSHHFNFKLDGLIGFNFNGKTVGIIGLGSIGRAAAAIFNGMGCHVIGYDLIVSDDLKHITQVSLNELLHESDIISLHLPLTPETKYIINASTIATMKDGVMLINTARGALIKTIDLSPALDSGKIGYLGLDVYEYEKDLFSQDHSMDAGKDPLLTKLLTYPNVLITPHQAFLTKEALKQIAILTIKNLDLWQKSGSSSAED